MDGSNLTGKLKRLFKRRSKSTGKSSSSATNPVFTLLHDNSRPGAPHLQVKASSSSLRKNVSVNNNTISQSSEQLSNSQSLSSSVASPLSASPGPAQPSAWTPPSAVIISPSVSITEALPSTPSHEGTSSTPATEETSSIPASPVNLWKEVFDKVNDETKKWIQDHNLNSTEQSQPEGQIKELMNLLKSKTLAEEKDIPLKIKIGKQEIIVREYVADAVNFLTMAGDVAMTFAPPQASAPWAAAKALLKIPVKEIEQMAALAGTIQWFTRIIRRGQVYELLYNATTTDEQLVSNLHEVLRDLYIAAMELLARSDVLFGSGMAKQTLNAILRPEQASGLILDLSKKEQKVLLEVQGCKASRNARADMKSEQRIKVVLSRLDEMSLPITRIDEGVAKLLEASERDRRDSLMDFISSEKSGKSHSDISAKRTEDTGDWLINHKDFRDWQAIPSSSSMLCLEGTVGTGKTYLVSRVIDYVKGTLKTSAHDEGFAFFYCDRPGSSMQDPLKVLQSFVRQLSYDAYNDDCIRKKINQLCRLAKQEGRGLSYKECQELILDLLNIYSRSTIILDALDESDIASYNLAETLFDLVDKARKPVKVFISSRPGREYLEPFKTESTIIVNSGSQQGDIEKFLNKNLYTTPFFKGRNGEIQKLIRETFVSRNGGMFLWVYMQVQRLKKCTLDDAIKSWAKKTPRNLKDAYDQLWNNLKEEHDKHDVALAERAIQWVLCSFVPLKSEFLLEAIRYSFEGDTLVQKEQLSEQQILSLCQDLLTIDTEKEVWMLPHASVAEYFESGDLILSNCDAFASKILLNTLMGSDKNGPQYRYIRYLKVKTFEEYVANTWFEHVKRYDKWLGSTKGANPDTQLVASLKRFLGSPQESSNHYRQWAEESEYELMPINISWFAVCYFGFYYVLSDWWNKDNVKDMALIHCQDAYGSNSLSLVGKGGCVAACRYLLRVMDVNNPSSQIHMAMERAIENRHKDIVSLLVMQGKQDVINLGYWDRKSPAQYAIRYPSMLQWLLDQGWVDVDGEGEQFGERHCGNLLIQASMDANRRSMRILLKAGADVNAAVELGTFGSALAAVISGGGPTRSEQFRLGPMQELLDNGADPNLPLKVGSYGSALEASIVGPGERTGRLVALLLDAGADPAMLLDRGQHGSALAAAACYGLKDLLVMMIAVTGKDRAIECLRRSRHPGYLNFYPLGENFYPLGKTKEHLIRETVAYLTQQIGVDGETLYKIGLWEVEPEEVGTINMDS